MSYRNISSAACLVMALAFAGCPGDVEPDPNGSSDAGPESNALPNFSLPDVNVTSATYAQDVSPRDYLEKVSGWYFGHST